MYHFNLFSHEGHIRLSHSRGMTEKERDYVENTIIKFKIHPLRRGPFGIHEDIYGQKWCLNGYMSDKNREYNIVFARKYHQLDGYYSTTTNGEPYNVTWLPMRFKVTSLEEECSEQDLLSYYHSFLAV